MHPHVPVRWLAPLLFVVALLRAEAANPPPTQVYYVPLPEDNQLAGFSAINGAAVNPLAVFVTFSAATDNTVIYYDHWEDGYETDITNPVQPTTKVFGDGNPANGYPPGNAGDLIPAGTVFSLRNYVFSTDLAALDYDGRDKVASYKPISLTKTCFPASTNSLLAGCVEVFEQGLWGTEYRVPVGVDMPTTTPASPLTNDYDIFNYTAISVMAGAKGANVQIDADNNGAFEQNLALAEGQNVYVTDVNTGARVVSDQPVQVVLFSGRIGSNYQSRDTSLLPTYRWSNSYYTPVSTDNSGNYRTVVFLYNPSSSDITVSYDYRGSSSAYTTATVSVPAGGNARVTLSPAGTGHSGAYHFYTTGANPPSFYAMSAVDAGNSSTSQNQAYDGGFTLVGRPSLTTQVLLSLGIGRDPYSATNPTENGNPVWITTVGNGHTQATVYVDYNGDNAGAYTDPNGNNYDISYNLRELEQQKIFDPDGDQSGMLVYSLDPTVKIAAAWAQDPGVATTSQPGLDVSTLIPPLREGGGGKTSSIAIDADGDGAVSAGDTLEYDIRGVNSARSAIPGPFAVTDDLPTDVSYIAGSTRFRYSVGGSWQAWTPIPDDVSGTSFPLDGTGFSVPGNLGIGQQLQVTFRAAIKPREQLSGEEITNTGTVEISPYGLLVPIDWTDTVFGSIGDRVWIDSDGDGIQDPEENGLPGIDVFLDLNNNGVRDSIEPLATTDAAGNYLFAGLVSGSYNVRVDPADIAAADVGYGPTYDLDGNATAHVAVVTLGIAEDRADVDFGYRVGASIGDRVWQDRDADGIQENGEPGLNGVRVYLDLDNDNSYDLGEPATTTSGDGTYYIGNLDPGTYAVRVDTTTLPAGSTLTYDLNGGLDHEASVTLIAAEHRADLDFGYRGNLSIGDLVWEDANADGSSGVSVTYDINNGRIDLNGDGEEDGADDGYIGTMRIIDGYVDIDNDNSTPIDNGDDGTFLGVNIVNGGFDMNNSGGISTSGSNDDGQVVYTTTEAGIASVRVYVDVDNDGVFDANEPSALTDASGLYSIGNLLDGTHMVRIDTSSLPSSYAPTYDLDGALDHAAAVTLGGSSRSDVDFGYRNSATIGDFVWNDRDADGVQDAGEPGIEGVLVYLDADNDNLFDQGVEQHAITNVNGYYQIVNVAAGTHAVRVDFGTLPQGSVQTYDLSGGLDHEASRTVAVAEQATNVDFGYRATASVGDLVWNDSDADGFKDASESGIQGVRVYLDINGNGAFDSATEPSATTNSSGAYTIDSLLPGTFTARIDTSTLPAGFVQTYDLTGAVDHSATFSLSASQARTDVDFAYTQQVAIGDFVWNDADADGRQDVGESGIDGVTVTAFFAATDAIAASTVTAGGGAYSFSLMPGTYYLVFDTPAGFHPTPVDQGSDASDSDAGISNGRTANVTLTGGQSDLSIDAGFYQPGTIFGHLYIDLNGNGIQDGAEPDLADVDVIVTDVNGGTQTVSTDSNGDWSATVPPGLTTADVDETDPEYPVGHTQTEGNDPTTVTAVSAGSADAGNDGYFLPGAISGSVLADTDDDGDGDVPLENVVVRLLDSLGNPVLDGFGDPVTTTTLADGSYQFGGLPPGDYRVAQDQPAGYASVSDTDGPNDNVIGNVTAITVTPGANNGGNDFIEIELGSISGTVLADDDNNGSGDSPLSGVVLNLLDGSGNPVLDGLGAPVQVATNAAGFYQFTLVPTGTYRVSQNQPSGYGSVSDVDGANNNVIGDETPVVITPGLDVTGRDFVEIEFGVISGSVLADVDDDGDGDAPLAGVTLTLLDGAGDPVATTTTDALGGYRFDDLFPGDYQVSETQPSGYGSVSDVDGGNKDLIGNVTAIAVNPGQEVGGRDFIEIELGTISGYVFVGSTPLAGVTLTLLDEYGNPVDGDPDTPGVQPITTVTDGSGFYQFTGVVPGIYQVGQTQPYGYDSFGDIDGGDIDIIGDVSPIALLPGQHSQNNNFVETLDTCPDDWAHWKFLHPAETPGGNPDADNYDNFAEFAFAMPHADGSGSPWLGATAWIIRPSTLAPGTLEGVFVRPKGAPLNVVYNLEYAAAPGNPTVWQTLVIDLSNSTSVDNGDCTETVTIHDLETLTGLTGGNGIVRIRAELDDDGGNDEIDHTSHAETEGWQETALGVCCRTYNNPFLRESLFTGTISAVSGQDLTFAVSGGAADIGSLLGGGTHFLEVSSGENEGHRFDIVSASGNTVTVASDAVLDSPAAPFNTRTGAPPADLTGDTVSIRRHWTLGELFPADAFGATGSQTTADQVQLFAAGAWTILWNYDDLGAPRWVDIADSGMADQAGIILAPGQGMFFNNRTAVTSILAYGEVRANDFVRPLPVGNALVGGGYPVDQTPEARAMNVAGGFYGSADFKTADSIFVWRKDANATANGYDTYYLVNGAPVNPSFQRWVRVGDAALTARGNETLLLRDRSVFVRSRDGLPAYTSPAPWTP